MNLLNRLTIQNLKLNKKRTIVTIIGIILSVALITALSSLYTSLLDSLVHYETREKGYFHAAYYNVPKEDIQIFKNNKNIEDMYFTKDIGYAKIESKNEYKPYALVKGFTKDALEQLSIKLVEGKLPTNDREILIPTHLKTNGRLSLNVGDTITLKVGKRVVDGYELNQSNPYNPEDIYEIVDGKAILDTKASKEEIVNPEDITYTVVGIMERPASNVEEYSAPGYTFATLIDKVDNYDNVDIYVKYYKKVVKNYEKITYELLGLDYEKVKDCFTTEDADLIKQCDIEYEKATYDINFNEYLIKLQTDPLGIKTANGMLVAVLIVCGIIVVTSVFCIKNSFDISITEKIKQYGMLRSIGATKKQIKRNVFYEATILGLIGIPLGILSGFLASYVLIIITNLLIGEAISIEMIFSFSYIAVVLAIILGIVTIYLSAIRSAVKASKVSPIESIKNNKEIKIKSKKLKTPKIINKLFGIGGEISFKNLKRNKKKYRTTVISIIVSVTVFITLSYFMSSVFTSLKEEYNVMEYNFSVHVYGKKNEVPQKINEIINHDSIEKYIVTHTGSISVDPNLYNKEYKEQKQYLNRDDFELYLTIVSLDNESYKEYIKELGLNYNDIKDKGILYNLEIVPIEVEEKGKKQVINKRMQILDINKNDIITGKMDYDEKINNSIKIGCVTDKLPWSYSDDKGYPRIYVTEELYNKLFSTDNQTSNYEIRIDSNNADKLQDDLEIMLKEFDNNISNYEESAKVMQNLFTLIGIFFYGFIVVISLIGVTNIFNTITTNVELRKPEFAMLRSIGMTNKEFNRMIRLETLFMGLKSLFFGILFGLILTYLIYINYLKNDGFIYAFPLDSILISVIVVFLLITIIMKYSVNKISKQNVIETIRNENI